MPKKKILLLYEYFYPGFKAGGPIQSLVNLVLAMQHQYEFYIATTAYDMQTATPYPNVVCNKWVNTQLTPNALPVKVWYSSNIKPGYKELLQTIQTSGCTTIYINGFYTNYFLFPLLYLKLGKLKNMDCIVAPRGMLTKGALSVKPFRKKIYFTVIKCFGLLKTVRYHATNTEEVQEIQSMFGRSSSITLASNVSKPPFEKFRQSTKNNDELRLVFLALISPMKNLLLLLQYLQSCSNTIVLDIYGPVKDKAYWQQCLQAIQALPKNIKVHYKGDAEPHTVQNIFTGYDAMILLTKGENFGHAIYESLSVGTPVIISHFTPWNNLQEKKAGWNININNKEELLTTLHQLSKMTLQEHNDCSNNAWHVAKDYYEQSNYTKNYNNLFS